MGLHVWIFFVTTDQQIWCSTGDVTVRQVRRKYCVLRWQDLWSYDNITLCNVHQYSSTETAWYLVLWISLRFEHSVGACTGSLWFVRAIDLYCNRLKKQAIRFPGTVQSELKSAVYRKMPNSQPTASYIPVSNMCV